MCHADQDTGSIVITGAGLCSGAVYVGFTDLAGKRVARRFTPEAAIQFAKQLLDAADEAAEAELL